MKPWICGVAAAALLSAPAFAQTVVIVRHGEKVDESADAPLSDAGKARAEALARSLSDARLAAVITTPLQRTRQTGEPAAAAAGVAVTVVSLEGGGAAHVARVTEAVRAQPADGMVLVVGHSNTAPAIAQALGDPAPEALRDCDYDRLTVIQLGSGAAKVVRGRYGEPSRAC